MALRDHIGVDSQMGVVLAWRQLRTCMTLPRLLHGGESVDIDQAGEPGLGPNAERGSCVGVPRLSVQCVGEGVRKPNGDRVRARQDRPALRDPVHRSGELQDYGTESSGKQGVRLSRRIDAPAKWLTLDLAGGRPRRLDEDLLLEQYLAQGSLPERLVIEVEVERTLKISG